MSEKKKEKNNENKKDFYWKVLNKAFSCAFFILIFIFMLSVQLNKYPTNLDELWNYNTARCIKNGLIPYKDISMITTPLFPTIVAICLKIFGDNLFVFRIVGSVLFTLILFFTYKIFYELLKKENVAIIFTGIICFVLYRYFMVDYNFFVLLIALIIEYLDLRIHQKDLLIGILAGLAICSKQTLGFFILLYVLLIDLLFVKNKDDWKNYFKIVTNRLIGAFIPILIFMIFLIRTKSYNDFISYAILGIKTFTNSIPYKKLILSKNIIVKVLAIIMPFFITIMVVYSLYKIFKSKKINHKNIISVFSSIPLLITVYPIADEVHFFIAIFQFSILLLYVLYFTCIKLFEKMIKYTPKEKAFKYLIKNKINVFLEKFIVAFLVLLGLYEMIKISFYNYKEYKLKLEQCKSIIEYENSVNDKELFKHFKNIPLTTNYIKLTQKFYDFYKENDDKKIILVDAEACAYDIPMDIYNKNFDMFLKGNIGKDGEDGIIKNIENSTNTLYLIKKEGKELNWQTPKNVIEYIRKNLKKSDSVESFDIYSKP